MRGLSLFNKIVFAVNSIFAFLLLLACVVPYVEADRFPYIAVLNLGIPVLVFVNLLFALYWGLAKRKQFFLSFPILVLGYLFVGSFIEFQFTEEVISEEDLSVMTFNVRAFNKGCYIDRSGVYEETFDFIATEDPDIICFQEVDVGKREDFKKYPYSYLKYYHHRVRTSMGIFSKYPIINTGDFEWPSTRNNGTFVDIQYKKDTIRVYNLHFESFGVNPSRKAISKEPSVRLFKRLNEVFRKQSEQAKSFLNHRNSVPYKTIVCGDFNNTQFSHTYRMVKGDMLDTFNEKGNGLGRTFNVLRFPFRIDHILVDPDFEVRAHKNYDVHFSDHFPVMASFRLKGQ